MPQDCPERPRGIGYSTGSRMVAVLSMLLEGITPLRVNQLYRLGDWGDQGVAPSPCRNLAEAYLRPPGGFAPGQPQGTCQARASPLTSDQMYQYPVIVSNTARSAFPSPS